MITVGDLQAAHRDALGELLRATNAFTPDEVGVALELFDETYGPEADASEPSDYEFVAAFDDAGSLAGYGCYGATPGTDGTYDLYWIAVDPAHQGQGVGSALLAEVERRVGARSARMLVVETSGRDGYEAARRFYGAHGYEVTARLRDFYAPADDRVVFTRHLGRSPSSAPQGAPPS
jgi:ribosomal protein S18 acetylase RimI-like enzyme